MFFLKMSIKQINTGEVCSSIKNSKKESITRRQKTAKQHKTEDDENTHKEVTKVNILKWS